MISIKQAIAISLCFLACGSNFAVASDSIAMTQLTIEEAYQAIPHRRTEYSASTSLQPSAVSDYLEDLFKATDLALIERINGLNDAYDSKRYQYRIDQLKAIDPPKEVDAAHQLIVAAVNEHKQYFNNAKRETGLIRSSHTKLIQAYKLLMNKLPDTQDNQRAYFDHLCALDFI